MTSRYCIFFVFLVYYFFLLLFLNLWLVPSRRLVILYNISIPGKLPVFYLLLLLNSKILFHIEELLIYLNFLNYPLLSWKLNEKPKFTFELPPQLINTYSGKFLLHADFNLFDKQVYYFWSVTCVILACYNNEFGSLVSRKKNVKKLKQCKFKFRMQCFSKLTSLFYCACLARRYYVFLQLRKYPCGFSFLSYCTAPRSSVF